MSALKNKRVVIGLGAVTAVAVGAAVALGLGRGAPAVTPPPPAAEGGLQVEVSETARASLDPAKPLRCFVDGAFVGMETLADCAERNGVAAQALDVGLDESGAVAAAVDAPLDPLPPIEVAEAPVDVLPPLVDLGDSVGTAPGPGSQAEWGECMQHGRYGWAVVSQGAPLGVCVNLLFDGRCEEPGGASYGRWGGQTVRLVTGRVEIAQDGREFTTLVEQRGNCTLPPI